MPMKYARLTEPLVRDNGVLRTASWDEALDRAASGFRAAVEAKGPDTFGMSAAPRRPTRSTSSRRSSPASAIGTQQHRLLQPNLTRT